MAKKEKNAFMIWYHSYQGRKVVGSVYSLGASLVILGALFKILHLPGASQMLMLGMCTESLLFAISVLDEPFEDVKWSNIFPSLVGEKKDPLINYIGGGSVSANQGMTAQGVNPIKDEDVKAFSESLKSLSEAAQQMAGISKVAGLTDTFAQNITSASQAAAQFATKQQNLDAASDALLASYTGITENMATVQANTKLYVEKADTINKNLAAINSVYEIQLKNIQNQAELVEKQTAIINVVAGDINKVQQAMAVSAVDVEKYKDETAKLAKKVADLNAIYGNMLSAINS
ncbi:MAG TPA: gliding motility protein GldL [Paludibacteraceae bacterium]|nr:gliding motility protein GldL [Paludibacteraceae bacterium]HPD28141.1 gliding motility protein GldL [Paludibacteraceae bacterium]HRR59069.1 gliding motility protein GldL [Paludibacteraceae bacterium]HRU72313.1 gliding motility protein GldL [Paludibacteraceae bacterium]